jgi:nucleotide-binding universal stress UspA family protein
MMYKRILLLLDGSSMAELALPHATALSEKFQAELVLLRVLDPLGEKLGSQYPGLTYAEEATSEQARKYLEKVASGIRKQGIRVKAITLSGRPQTEILSYSEKNKVDLIVFTTRGQSGVNRWLRGSIADRVARGARVPVLIVQAP